MPKIYVSLLYAEGRTWEQIPKNIKEDVKAILKSDVSLGIITPDRYKELTGELYSA